MEKIIVFSAPDKQNEAAKETAMQYARLSKEEADRSGGQAGRAGEEADRAKGYADRIDLGVLDAAVLSTGTDAETALLAKQASEQAAIDAANDANAQIAPNVSAAVAAKNAAEAALALSEAAALAAVNSNWTYTVEDNAALLALTGMTANQTAFVKATEHQWKFESGVWVDKGPSVVAHKANAADVTAAPAWTAASDVVLDTAYVGVQSTPITGIKDNGSRTFVLPHPAASDGVIDQVQIFGGSASGALKLRVFNLAGGIFTQVGVDTAISVNADTLNTFNVGMKIAAGQYLGLYAPQNTLSYLSGGADDRAWTPSTTGDFSTVEVATAQRPGVIQILGRHRSTGATHGQFKAAVEAGEAVPALVAESGSWKVAAESIVKNTYMGLEAAPVAALNDNGTRVFVLPRPAVGKGFVDKIELYGGASAGVVAFKVFTSDGVTFTQVGPDHPANVQPAMLNILDVNIPIEGGQYIGFYPSAGVVAYKTTASTPDLPIADRAWMRDVSGNATTVMIASAGRAIAPQVRVTAKVGAASPDDMQKAAAVGRLHFGAPDGLVVATRRPLILDLEGVYGITNSLYLPREIFYTANGWKSFEVVNPAVTLPVGNYCRLTLGLSDWDGTAANSVHYDPATNAYILVTGSGVPTNGQQLIPIFQITGRPTEYKAGSWRSGAGLNVEVAQKPRGAAVLADLYDALTNPLRDCRIALVGDSITWGMTATGNGPLTPRNHLITDVRDLFTSATWANRIRKWGAFLSCGGANGVEDAVTGRTDYSKTIISPVVKIKGFSTLSSTGREVAHAEGVNNGARLKSYLDTESGGKLVFQYIGSEITLVHAALESGVYEFYIDGELVTTFTSGAVQFGVETTLTPSAFGLHTVEVRPTGSAFRLEAIKRTKRFALTNSGIIGSNSAEWLPSGGLLAAGVPADTTHVILQLGTNDRLYAATSMIPAGAAALEQNLHVILDWMAVNRPLAKVMLMAPPFAPTDVTQGSSDDIARAVARVARQRGTGFIDQWGATAELQIAGEAWLADALHPNDLGHRVMAQAIMRAIKP